MVVYSQIGLMLNMLGVCLVIIYGLPSRLINPYEQDMMSIGPLQKEQIERQKRNNRKINFFSYVGLTLIFFGFIFQFIGTFR
jgi:hypothetical protein